MRGGVCKVEERLGLCTVRFIKAEWESVHPGDLRQ